MGERTLLVCTGSSCRKALRKNDRFHEALASLPVAIEPVGCQKVCRGPVVGTVLEGKWQWFERMGSKRALHALAELVETDAVGKPLRKRRNKKRAGKRRS